MTQGLLDIHSPDVVTLSKLFSLLGDPTRVRILLLLCHGELNVSRLCEILGMAQPTVSHHLGLLRRGGLLRTRRDGKAIHYALDGRIEYTEGCEISIKGTAGLRIRILK